MLSIIRIMVYFSCENTLPPFLHFPQEFSIRADLTEDSASVHVVVFLPLSLYWLLVFLEEVFSMLEFGSWLEFCVPDIWWNLKVQESLECRVISNKHLCMSLFWKTFKCVSKVVSGPEKCNPMKDWSAWICVMVLKKIIWEPTLQQGGLSPSHLPAVWGS